MLRLVADDVVADGDDGEVVDEDCGDGDGDDDDDGEDDGADEEPVVPNDEDDDDDAETFVFVVLDDEKVSRRFSHVSPGCF